MKVSAVLILVTATWLPGCASDRRRDPPSMPPAAQTTPTNTRKKASEIYVGMPANEAWKKLEQFGATRTGEAIGLMTAYIDPPPVYHDRWWLLQDNTILWVHTQGPSAAEERVESIEKGPTGQGYPGKVAWRAWEEWVTEVDLQRHQSRKQ